jgi:hypothetical protein
MCPEIKIRSRARWSKEVPGLHVLTRRVSVPPRIYSPRTLEFSRHVAPRKITRKLLKTNKSGHRFSTHKMGVAANPKNYASDEAEAKMRRVSAAQTQLSAPFCLSLSSQASWMPTITHCFSTRLDPHFRVPHSCRFCKERAPVAPFSLTLALGCHPEPDRRFLRSVSRDPHLPLFCAFAFRCHPERAGFRDPEGRWSESRDPRKSRSTMRYNRRFTTRAHFAPRRLYP